MATNPLAAMPLSVLRTYVDNKRKALDLFNAAGQSWGPVTSSLAYKINQAIRSWYGITEDTATYEDAKKFLDAREVEYQMLPGGTTTTAGSSGGIAGPLLVIGGVYLVGKLLKKVF